ncbi:hypothetical protein DUNSADRAFT_17831 [Dunaliella salina]|uniref:Uncharacterized protein n=1 Tax=Dunaliella salina TaxID=3046 RepID=A0ABQ7GZT5_DUNSA|nr:hypothetical protein DUNSADRAFT_17831 [Dunaliella salina]|eukprot:KAF5840096.1 hypothetical protein DUNSADRAFT_17831 [Dunaliella salina]
MKTLLHTTPAQTSTVAHTLLQLQQERPARALATPTCKQSTRKAAPLGNRSQTLQRGRGRCAPCYSAPGDELPSTSQQMDPSVPWNFGFQLNERYLKWGVEANDEMSRRVLSHNLGLPLEEVDRRLHELGLLVPDMVGKLTRTRADILLKLTSDLPATTAKLLGLRDLFPGINVSLLVSRWPYLLSDYELPEVAARLDEMRKTLPGVRVEALVDLEPQIMKVDLNEVLQNIRRILPNRDPVPVLLAQPQMVLDMQQAGLPTAMDVEGSPGRVVQ